jgi:hypothetical protein
MMVRYFWGQHQRFFRDLCVAGKVDEALKQTRQALHEGKCVVIGLQTTGEAKTREIMKERASQGEHSQVGERVPRRAPT